MSVTATAPIPATGQKLLQVARQHVGEKYIFGVLVPKNNAGWTGAWDCAEFASWLIFQASATLYGCDRDFGDPATADAFTGYWDRDAKSLGQIISIEHAARTPGAAVLRIPQIGATGHIVISDGVGGTVRLTLQETELSSPLLIIGAGIWASWSRGLCTHKALSFQSLR